VKFKRNFLHLLHHDIFRQNAVNAAVDAVDGQFRGAAETRHLVERVHAGIRPPRADDGNFLGRDFLNRLFQHLLYGQTVFLPLPAAVGAAVVFHNHFKIAHVFIRHSYTVRGIYAVCPKK